MSGKHWTHIPGELRERAQWMLAGPDKSPRMPWGTTNASIHDACARQPFDVAVRNATRLGFHIGYVLTADDPFPYTCIDLDWCDEDSQRRKGKPIDPAQWSINTGDLERFQQIMDYFDSYTERSANGRGLHIWVKGKIGRGIKEPHLEVYSQERFIVCTGDVWIDKPVNGRPTLISDRRPILTRQ